MASSGTHADSRLQACTPMDPSHRAAHKSVAHVDAALTLNRKNSWFGTVRDAVQKGALSAKQTVDKWRQPLLDRHVEPLWWRRDHRVADSALERPPLSSNEFRGFPRPSTPGFIDDHASTAGIYHSGGNAFLEPDSASTRQRSSSSQASITSDECTVNTARHSALIGGEPQLPNAPSPAPSRKRRDAALRRRGSIAQSIVGSIRGFGRRLPKTRTGSQTQHRRTDRPAESVPVPSSPIDIPPLAPALELDLGPAAFVTTNFDGSPADRSGLDDASGHFHTITQHDWSKTPIEKSSSHLDFQTRDTTERSVTAAAVLPSPQGPFVANSEIDVTNPTTPIHDIFSPLEFDGTLDPAECDSLQLFERSVTATNGAPHRGVRTIRSLDAMARACSTPRIVKDPTDAMAEAAEVAHRYDDEFCAIRGCLMDSRTGQPAAPSKILSDHMPSSSIEASSEATVSSLPSDMTPLERQSSANANFPVNKSFSPAFGGTCEQSVSPERINYTGPPSPTCTVHLPFRLKTSPATVQTASTHATVGALLTAVAEPERLMEDDYDPRMEEDTCMSTLNDKTTKPQRPSMSGLMSSEDDMERRTQALQESDIYIPDDQFGEMIQDSHAIHPSELDNPFDDHHEHSGNSSICPSRISERREKVRMAVEGSADHEFSLETWLRNAALDRIVDFEIARCSEHSRSIRELACPKQEHEPLVDLSISTAGEVSSRATDYLVTASDPSKTNTRGSALKYESTCEPVANGTSRSPKHRPLHFIVGDHDDIELYEIQLPGSHTSSRNDTESIHLSHNGSFEERVNSQESLPHSLRAAVSDANMLHEHLEVTSPESDIPGSYSTFTFKFPVANKEPAQRSGQGDALQPQIYSHDAVVPGSSLLVGDNPQTDPTGISRVHDERLGNRKPMSELYHSCNLSARNEQHISPLKHRSPNGISPRAQAEFEDDLDENLLLFIVDKDGSFK